MIRPRSVLPAFLALSIALTACGATPQAAPTAAPPAAPATAVPQATATAAEQIAPSATVAAEQPATATTAAEATVAAATPQATTAAEAQVAGGGTFTRAIASEPADLDPHGAVSSGKSVILPYLLDTLVYRTVTNEFVPYLAESWEIAPDATSVTFKLKAGVTFQDGTPLDADAVIFTFQRFQELGARSPYAGAIMNIAAMEATDAQTVVFRFKEPTTTFLSTLASTYAGIISPTAAKAAGDTFAQNPVGSGPYRLAEWRAGVSLTLARNPDYNWGPSVYENAGPAYLEQLVFRIVPDAAAQLAAFQSGEVDQIFVNQPGQVAQLRAMPNATVTEATLSGLVYLGFNCAKPPFDDARVRQALAHAINKPEIIETALGGIGLEAFSPLASTLPYFDPALKADELGYDPEKAAALLTEAGFTKGDDGSWTRDGQKLQVSLVTSNRPPNQGVATVIQAQLAAIGVPAEVQLLESNAAMEAQTKGEYDLTLWRYDWSDADVLNIYLSSGRIGRTNRVFYSNPDLDALLEQALWERDPQKAHDLYFQAQQIILADAPWQPLYTPVDVYATNNRVQGVVFGPMGRVLLDDAHIVE